MQSDAQQSPQVKKPDARALQPDEEQKDPDGPGAEF